MGMRDLLQHISGEVCRWPDVTSAPHRFGGTEYRFSQAEIGHLHSDGTLDIPYPMPIRNQLIADGIVEKHHFLPESGWVTFYVTATNLEQALWLLRLSYLRYALRRASNADGSASPEYQSILKELETTTPPILSAAMIRSHAPQPRA
jgi:Family of unknown function (DUF5519)